MFPKNLRHLFYLLLLLVFTSTAIAATFTSSQSGNFNDSVTWEGETDFSTFPILISETLDDLKTVANGGKVQNTNGYDIIFASDSACSTKLNFEIESYSSTTGQLVAWVVSPTLNPDTDDTFYLCYGNNSVSSDQSNKTAVWDTNYLMVQHLNGTSTLSTTDSTSNSNNGVLNGDISTTSSGKIGVAGTFDGNGDFITSEISGTVPESITISAYIYPTNGGVVLSECDMASCGSWHDSQMEVLPTGEIMVSLWEGSMHSQSLGTFSLNEWHLVEMTYDNLNNVIKGYVDGEIINFDVVDKEYPETLFYAIGREDVTNNGDGTYFNGIIDEVRISNVARTSSWIKTEYNNQSEPSSFYSVEVETVGGSSYTYATPIVIDHTKVENNVSSFVPEDFDDVTISSATTVTVPANTISIVNDLTIESGASLSIGLNSKVVYYGVYTNNGTVSGVGEVKKALILEGDVDVSDTTPTFGTYCINGATVELLENNTVLASGTCTNNIVSLTSSSLTSGTHRLKIRETDGDTIRYSVTKKLVIQTDADDDIWNDAQKFIQLGTDGFPRIVFQKYIIGGAELNFIRCLDEDCVTSNTTILATSSDSTFLPSLNIDSNGYFRITYIDDSDQTLHFIRCLDEDCTTKNNTIITSAGNDGLWMPIFDLDQNDMPYIAFDDYVEDVSDNLKFAHCLDEDCITSNIIDLGSGYFASLIVGSDGLARIAYIDSVGDVHFVKCINTDCSSSSNQVVDSGLNDDYSIDLALTSTDLGKIVYSQYGGFGLKYAVCTNSDCSESTVENIDVSPNIWSSSIVLTSDNLARIAYVIEDENENPSIHYIECYNIFCSEKNLISIADSADGPVSIAINPSDDSYIVYNGINDTSLYLAYLSDREVTVSPIVTPAPANGPIVGSNTYIPNSPGAPLNPNQLFPGMIKEDKLVNKISISTDTNYPKITQTNIQPNLAVPIFIRYIVPGQISSDVKNLQVVLNSLGYMLASSGPGSPGNETTKFGLLTRLAVQRLQCEKLGICAGKPETTGYGNFGPRTRALVNNLIGR